MKKVAYLFLINVLDYPTRGLPVDYLSITGHNSVIHYFYLICCLNVTNVLCFDIINDFPAITERPI